MISESFLIAILFFSLFFELTLIPFPVVLLVSLILYIIFPKIQTVILVFLASIMLDVLNVSRIGQTAIFILISFLIVDLYRKSLEAKNLHVLLVILAFSTYLYARIFFYPSSILVYAIIFGIAGIIINYFLSGSILWLKNKK